MHVGNLKTFGVLELRVEASEPRLANHEVRFYDSFGPLTLVYLHRHQLAFDRRGDVDVILGTEEVAGRRRLEV